MTSENISLAKLQKLVPTYNGSVPRYTSYPTAVEFDKDVNQEKWLEVLKRDAINSNGDAALSLYFHLPFCHSLCYFCACNKVITKDYSQVEPYLQSLLCEIDAYAALLPENFPVEQIHWGGGTPNFFKPSDMKRLMDHIRQKFPNLISDVEISVELDPRTATRAHLEQLRKLGFTRISLGVQDFSSEVQQAMNRIQSFEMTRDLVHQARALSFSGINIDLIYGLPNQTTSRFLETIEQVLSLKADRVALYGYAHVTWIKKVQKALERAHLPTADERLEIFAAAIDKFRSAGYVYIGMDHFALSDDPLAKSLKDGSLNRNFMGYTTHSGAWVLGFGVSAISSIPSAFAQNTKEVNLYQQQVNSSGFAIEKGLLRSEVDQIRGRIIETILCSGHLVFKDYETVLSDDFQHTFANEIEELKSFEADGLLTLTDSSIVLTDVGKIFARNIAAVFDSYLAKHRMGGAKVFSQAV